MSVTASASRRAANRTPSLMSDSSATTTRAPTVSGKKSSRAAISNVTVVTANTLFAAATTLEDLSVVAVLGWLSPAVTILCARVVLHEHLRPVQWLAAAAVLTGVVCLALG